MDFEVAVSSAVVQPASSPEGGGGADAEGFGTRPRTDRPHSVDLFGARHSSTRSNAERALDLLIGVGIGVAAMYYLDPVAGARRRAAIRDRIVDALVAVGGPLDSTLLGRDVKRG